MPRRTVKGHDGPFGNVRPEEAREAVRSVGKAGPTTTSPLARAREIKERLREQGRTFSDSTELVREDREREE